MSATKPARGQWTADNMRELGVTTDIPTAASILAMGETKARELVRTGLFPVPVLKFGERYVIPTAPLRALLGIGDRLQAEQGAAST